MTKILLDLKPALDGFAGIPQESRLLFYWLGTLDGYDREGLIQHGGKILRSASPSNKTDISSSRRIYQHSRLVVSLFNSPSNNILETSAQLCQNYFALLHLQIRALTGVPISLSNFDGEHFEDFVWSTLFSKTLHADEKQPISLSRFRILKQSRKLFHRAALEGIKLFSPPRYAPINTKGYDFFVAQTPFPGKISKGTRMVVRYHDSVPMLMPHTIKDKAFHLSSHYFALQENISAGAWFSCVSESTRNDLVKIFPEAETKSNVIHNIVSTEYCDEESPKGIIIQIIRNRLSSSKEFVTDLTELELEFKKDNGQDFTYLLMVSTLEPRKNHLLLVSAWERLKYTSMPNLKLVVVGNKGWNYEVLLESFQPWAKQGELFHLSNLPVTELRVLYKHAAATICPSVGEGFDYSGVEAMQSGGVVISSDIPVHREIYQQASEYFNPYSSENASMVIQRVLVEEGGSIRQNLRHHGRQVSALYTPANILPKWDAFFQSFKKSS